MLVTRRSFFTLAAGTAFAFGVSPAIAADAALGVTAITQVFGSGQKLTAVAIEYADAISSEKLKPEAFAVEGRTVTRVYANTEAMLSQQGRDGKFVIVEMSPDDEVAALYRQIKKDIIRKPANVSITQVQPLVTVASGEVAASVAMANTTVRNLGYEDFQQLSYKHPASGLELKYNLFVPKDYDKAKAYPLVLFMHDAGVTSDNHDQTLVQGNGAISFASPEDQAKHPSFVLAPQFSRAIVNDNSEATEELDAVIDLIKQLSVEYSIDQKRLYTTGQSGGGMMSIAMNVKYPDFFAAAYLVACQWDPDVVAPLAKKPLWIVVSEGDIKAFPGQNAIASVLEAEGAKVGRAVWEGTFSQEQFRFAVSDIMSEGNPVKYVAFKKGTVVPAGQDDNPGANHVNTWRIAYSIPGIRDWLFAQSK